MPLESLLELVERLRERIDTHGNALRQSEALTRYALIDPLLRELGWDTSNPDMVVPEYNSGNGRADYALISNGSPVMMVEAKKLGTTLGIDVVSQILTYCQIQGTEFFCVTDGRRWEAYETNKPGPIDDKRIVSWDLKQASSAEVCLKALALWRPSVQFGHVAAGQGPVVVPVPSEPATGTTQTESTPQDEYEWQPLAEVAIVKNRIPAEILFPDGNKATLTKWSSILVEITRWLTDNGLLDSPILGVDPDKYIVNSEPLHPDGISMSPAEEVSEWFVSVASFPTAVKSRSQRIIQHVGQDPAQFKVRFS